MAVSVDHVAQVEHRARGSASTVYTSPTKTPVHFDRPSFVNVVVGEAANVLPITAVRGRQTGVILEVPRSLRPPPAPPETLSAELRQAHLVARTVVDLLLERLGVPSSPAPGDASACLPDDAIVDQTTGRVPKDLFLRLARLGAFPSFKEGKRVYAFWGEVRRALEQRMQGRVGENRPTPPREPADDLDDLRKEMGLKTRGAA